MPKLLNVIGKNCLKIRNQKGWTQEQVAAKSTIIGFRMTRGIYANIEIQGRKVSDYELFYLAKVFQVRPQDLLPDSMPEWTKNIVTGHCKDEEA